jgi:RNA polymerase sigma factor (sigma-70 family)
MKIYSKLSDHELIQHYLNGDVTAFSELLNRYKDKVFTSVLLLVKDRYLAEDIFQEAFINILNKLHENKYAEEGKFLPWAIRIARNLCIDHFRRVKRRPPIVTSDNQRIFDVAGFTEPSVDKKMIKGQTYQNINKMLDLLPEDQREVIIMRHYADMSFKDIASITNCSINTALGRMRYGLINLRKMMVEKQIALSVLGGSLMSLSNHMA